MKKILALVLALACILSLNIVAFAAPAVKASKAVVTVDFTGATLKAGDYKLTISGTEKTFTSGDDTEATIGAGLAALNFSGVATLSTGSYTSPKVTFTATDDGETSLTASIVLPTDASGVKVSVINGKDSANATGDEAFKAAPILPQGDKAFVESADDLSGTDTVKPGKTLYFPIRADYDNSDNFKLSVKKEDGSKNIDSVKIVEKKFDSELVEVLTTANKLADSKDRAKYVAVKLKDNMTDAEYKVSFEITATAKKDGIVVGTATFNKGDKTSFVAGKTWVTNKVDESSDQTWSAGKGGFIAKPQKNEENTVEWEDNNRTIAKMEFTADSDVNKYFPKLSTKWDSDIAAKFDGDAYYFSFVGNPTISATSRPVLSLYNPFVNDDDEYVVSIEDLVVYEVIDGELVDVTAKFTATTNDDGDEVLTTKTRTLGTYVIADAAAVEEAAETVEELPTTETAKPVPNTGR